MKYVHLSHMSVNQEASDRSGAPDPDPSAGSEISSRRHCSDLETRKLVFILGKGGVGRSTLSEAYARFHAEKERKTLWVTFDYSGLPDGRITPFQKNLDALHCDAASAFEEFIALKLKSSTVAKLFLKAPLVRHLAKAAPGIPDLVQLGKIYHELKHYDRVVVDLPSTGYGLAMFQSIQNFLNLFQGGPIHTDAKKMLEAFEDPEQTGLLITALPEEMPLQEALELEENLRQLLPKNPIAFVVNRVFPKEGIEPPSQPPSILPQSASDYIFSRVRLEEKNLELWRKAGISFQSVPLFLPSPSSASLHPSETRNAILKHVQAQVRSWHEKH